MAGKKIKLIDYLIIDYLIGRRQRVVLGSTVPDCKDVTSVVPQGSVLGPLLFLIFIENIPLSNEKRISYSALFADDLFSIFIFDKVNKVVSNRIKLYLDSLVEWLFKWRLKMNAKKCCYTIFSGAGKSSVSFKLKLKNDVIPYNKNPVFLGIIFDEYLCFNKHYENLRVRALKRFNIIKIFSYKSWHLNKHTLLNLYRSLIGSIFDYSSFTVSNCSKTSLMSLQTIQN